MSLVSYPQLGLALFGDSCKFCIIVVLHFNSLSHGTLNGHIGVDMCAVMSICCRTSLDSSSTGRAAKEVTNEQQQSSTGS